MAYKTRLLKPKEYDALLNIDDQEWIIPESDVGISWGFADFESKSYGGSYGDWVASHSHKWLNHVRNFRICVQAGGNLGLYPRMLAEHFNTVYTFEPAPENFFCLTHNCQRDNIVKFQAALGDHAGAVAVNYVPAHTGGSTINETEHGAIPVMPIDALNLFDVDLIALDCEGYEPKILGGARITIDRSRPVITCENAHNHEKLWKELGYVVAEESCSDSIMVPQENFVAP